MGWEWVACKQRLEGEAGWPCELERESPGPEQVSLVHPQSMEGQRGGQEGRGRGRPAPPGHSGNAGFAGRVVESHGRSGAEESRDLMS